MTNYTASFADIEADFIARHIPIDSPGFYDHPNFVAAERQDPQYLSNYARYVHDRPRDTAYDEYVRKTVPVVAQVFHACLKANGRLGACVDISALLSRALEKEGIWNFITKGSLTIEFPKRSRISPKYFWSIDSGDFTAAHAWVVAPPFYIVDIAVQLQPYLCGEEKYLPGIVCAGAEILAKGTLDDVVSPEIRAHLSTRGIPKSHQLQMVSAETPPFMNVFPARLFKFGETTLKFVPVATTAPDQPFEAMRAMLFNGRTGYEVYATDVKDALAYSKTISELEISKSFGNAHPSTKNWG